MTSFFAFFGLTLLMLGFVPVQETETVRPTVTILYDNYVYSDGTRADWGFSCLIKGIEKTILFDTGTKPEILFHNIKQLKVNPHEVKLIVLSHQHGDHTGGLFELLKRNQQITVYMPHAFPDAFYQRVKNHGAKAIAVSSSVKIGRNIYLTGQLGDSIPELSLIMDTDSGGILITGCSHPGILTIIRKAKHILGKDIHTVFGGFHLMQKTEQQMQKIIEQFKLMGVKKVGPTHCTGKKQIEMFKKAYGRNFIKMGTGKILEF